MPRSVPAERRLSRSTTPPVANTSLSGRVKVPVRPTADKPQTTEVEPTRKVFLRRRRSRSSDSRKSRKEPPQGSSSLHSKKRKTNTTLDRSVSSPVDTSAYPTGSSWKVKEHRRKQSVSRQSLMEGRRVISERRASYASCSDDEHYETSQSTFPNTAHSSTRHRPSLKKHN